MQRVLDLPEVSLVAVLDADKEGFLRNDRSLTQTAGRAARNANDWYLYTDQVTRFDATDHEFPAAAEVFKWPTTKSMALRQRPQQDEKKKFSPKIHPGYIRGQG